MLAGMPTPEQAAALRDYSWAPAETRRAPRRIPRRSGRRPERQISAAHFLQSRGPNSTSTLMDSQKVPILSGGDVGAFSPGR